VNPFRIPHACATFAAAVLLGALPPLFMRAEAAPPAPALVAPASGASLVQPIRIDWNAVSDPAGPIGSYTWQVATSSAFTTIVLAGFTNNLSDSLPTATEDQVSGLPNGRYFWRVKATQLVGGATGSVDSPWSAVRTFTVAGLGPAPGTPAITAPSNNAQFHVREFFDIRWSAVPGAQYYLLEADDQPSFSYPLTLTTNALTFGTRAEAGWGNALANVYYRVRAVSADNVRGLPSATVAVHITNAAPVPPAPALVAPAAGAAVSLPFTFDWSDTANPQVVGYDLDVDTDPNFAGSFGVLLLSGVSRSDFMITPDLLPPGNYFWRVRALHGDVFGPWSAGRAVRVLPPASPGDPGLFAIITTPGNAYGGNSTQARVLLKDPAPSGGAVVRIASDIPQAQTPASVIVPAGQTDAMVTPITTGLPPSNGIVGIVRAANAVSTEQSSLGVMPLLYGTSLGAESIIGGNSVTGTVTLQSAPPPGGATVRLISSDTRVARVPATVSIAAGATDATFTITTSPVTAGTRVVIETGTDNDGYRAPQAWIAVMPAGSPSPAPSLASLTLNPPSVTAGGTSTATLTLTSPAPAGGANVWVNGSMEGQVITPPGVTIPAGSTSATFTMTAPPVVGTHWVMIQARYGTTGGTQAKLLEIDTGPPGPPVLMAMNASGQDVVGGNSLRGTVALVTPAPAGGGLVNLASSNPAVAQVPGTATVAGGNSTGGFVITTSRVSMLTTAEITASAGGVSRSWFVNVAPDPNAPPLLQSMTISPVSVAGGTNATGTVFLSAPAPSGGVTVTLSTSNASVARAPGIVTVPAGQTSATFTITTFAVSANTTATITAFLDTTVSASFTVTRNATPPPPPPPPPGGLGAPSLVSPSSDARFAPGQSITFDWSDVTGAASYTIQIDDADTFPSPQVVSQTVTASQFSSSTLPTMRMWWRVRANDASGNAGSWSAVRRFEVKN
jgi:hypothetical protein